MTNLICRMFPQSQNSFLRYQVGRIEERALQIPVYDSNRRLVGQARGTHGVSVFHLLGWGESRDRAEMMAQEKL